MINGAIETPNVAKGDQQEGRAQIAEGKEFAYPKDDIDNLTLQSFGILAHQLMPHILQGNIQGSAHNAEVMARSKAMPVGGT